MSFDVTSLSDCSVMALKSRGEDYLLEVFRPWDCHEQEWADTGTAQLRFETVDLLVGRDPDQDANRRQWKVFTGIEGVHQGSTEGLVGDCVCWLMDGSLIKELGVHGDVLDLTLDVLEALDGETG